MSYELAMKTAGANVISYEQFGSYQGDWAALVEYKGERGIVFGSYGSCSGCDAFEAEFGWNDSPREVDGKYYGQTYSGREITKDEYDKAIVDYNERLSDFGEGYLKNIATVEIIQANLDSLTKDNWFDDERRECYEWALNQLKNNIT